MPPVIADTTYTFFPCDDPPTFSVFAVVSTLDEPVLDEVLEFNGTVTIKFNPSVLGTIDITLIPTESGVIFGVSGPELSAWWRIHCNSQRGFHFYKDIILNRSILSKYT